MKKSFLVVLITLLLLSTAVFVSAGGQQGEKGGASVSKGPVQLEFWTRETQSDRMATIQMLIDTYTAMNPDVSIKLVPVDENDMALNMRAAVASGKIPSIIEIDAEIAVALGTEGILDTEAADIMLNKVGKDRFFKGSLRLFESKDKGVYYAVPYHGMIQGIWYRADWFEKAGLQPPTTWEAVAKAAEYFNNPQKNTYGILVGTMETESYDEQCFTPIAMSNNAGLFDKDGNLIFNSPEMKEALEYYARLAKTSPPGPQTWRARDYYLQGKMAMFFYSTYIMDDLAILEVAKGSLTSDNFKDLKGAEFDPDLVKNTKVVTTISHKKDAGFGAVVSMAVPKQSDPAVRDAALDFLTYLYSPNAYITFLHMAVGGMMPVIEGVADTDRFLNDPKGVYSRYGKEKIMEIVDGLNNIESFGLVEGNRIEAASVIYSKKIIPQMIYKVTQEGMDVDDAMNWAESAMKELIK